MPEVQECERSAQVSEVMLQASAVGGGGLDQYAVQRGDYNGGRAGRTYSQRYSKIFTGG